MICTNQFLHIQIIIIVPRIGNALFDKRNHRSDLEKYNSMVIILPHRLELSYFKKSGDYENGTRRYRCLDCGKAFSPLTGTVFDAHKIPISEWTEYMIHLFEFHFLSSSARDNRNAKIYPIVPLQHKWRKNEDGDFTHEKGEKIK